MYDAKRTLSDEAIAEATDIGEQVAAFIALLQKNITEVSPELIDKARVLENSIDEKRKIMRQGHIDRLSAGKCEVETGLIFIDMLTSFEKMGDHAFNVAEVLAGVKKKLLPQKAYSSVSRPFNFDLFVYQTPLSGLLLTQAPSWQSYPSLHSQDSVQLE